MREFSSFCRFDADEKEKIIKALSEAGLMEVYQTWDWRNLDNYHTDRVGDYVGDFWDCIPEGAEVRWTIMDAEEYSITLCANTIDIAEDSVCEETGKVLVVQFYVPQDDFEDEEDGEEKNDL